jgi:hypothetical protein
MYDAKAKPGGGGLLRRLFGGGGGRPHHLPASRREHPHGHGAQASAAARWGTRALLLALPLLGCVLAVATLYSSLFLRHRGFRHRRAVWTPAPALPEGALDEGAHHHHGAGGRRPLAEWAAPTTLHRAAAAYCLASPACRLAVVFTDGSDDPAEEVDLTVRGSSAGGKVVPLVRMHVDDEFQVAGGPSIVTCPSPSKEAWLVYAGARWVLGSNSPDFVSRCAAAVIASGGGGDAAHGHGPADDHSDPALAAAAAPGGPGSGKPRWVPCDWLLRLTKGDPLARPADCGILAPGAVAAVARYVTPGSAPLALVRGGGHLLLHGPDMDVALARRNRLVEAGVYKGLPQPGDGVQARLTLLTTTTAASSAGDDAKQQPPPPSAAEVLRLFGELRTNDAFTRQRPLLPLLSFEPCAEWPVTRRSDAVCGARPFGPFDHLLAVKNAIMLAARHKYRLVPPDMQRWHEDGDGHGAGGGHAAGGALARLPVASIVDLPSLASGLRGTADVVDTTSFDPAQLGWSHRGVSLVGGGADGGGHGAAAATTDGDASGLEADTHAALRANWGVGKVHLDVCPVGAVGWQPRGKVHWHMPLRARATAAMEPPPRVSALRRIFQREVARQSGRPGYNAVDLRHFHANQERCACMAHARDRRLDPGAVNCGLGPAELAHTLALTLGFDRGLPLFVAVDGLTAEEVLPELQRTFPRIVTLEDVLPGITAAAAAAGEGDGDGGEGDAPHHGGGPWASQRLSEEEVQLLEGAIAEEAASFAGQSLSALSFHVKERRQHRSERGPRPAAPLAGAGDAAAEAGVLAVAARGAGAALAGAAWVPRQSAYFDRTHVRSCAVSALATGGALVADSGVRGGVHAGGAQGQYAEPCEDELRLWLQV